MCVVPVLGQADQGTGLQHAALSKCPEEPDRNLLLMGCLYWHIIFASSRAPCGQCRTLQYITIRKQEEELHASIEAGAPDEEIGKLARISHRVSAPHLSLRTPSDIMIPAAQIDA